MPFGFPDSYEVKTVAPWPKSIDTKPEFEDSDENKKLFGIELAKNNASTFNAALEIFPQTNVALWVSRNWISDPIVIASKDLYSKTLNSNAPLLDKEQLAAKVLELADETIEVGNGQIRYVCDAKDRVAALKLYSEIAGYTGKVNIDASTKNFVHNEMIIKLVKPKEETLKSVSQTIDNDTTPVEPLPIKLKLVSAK